MGAYTRTIDSIVDSPKLLNDEVYHFLDAVRVGDIELVDNGMILCMGSILFALLGRLLGRFFIDIRKDYRFRSSFGHREGGLLPDAPSSLQHVRLVFPA